MKKFTLTIVFARQVGDRVDASRKSKEDRKKSIIQAVSDFFIKKSPSPPKTPSSHSPTKNLNINFPKKVRRSSMTFKLPVIHMRALFQAWLALSVNYVCISRGAPPLFP